LILVTGPQRSGTTIAAKMIAQDTGHLLVLEERFGTHDKGRWEKIIEGSHGVVIQCPTMCRWAHQFGERDDVLVVLMRRDIDDIIASQERIGWRERRELVPYGVDEGPIAAVKYDYWEREQVGQIRHSLELEYEDLSDHPLWVPKARRRRFGPRQTAR